MRRLTKCGAALAAFTTVAALLAAPTTAETSIGPGVDDTPDIGTGDPLMDQIPVTTPDDLVSEAPPGPVGSVDGAVYDTVWTADAIVPADVEPAQTVDGAAVHAYTPDDGSWLMAIIVIDSGDAPTEYRFNNAVPASTTAKIQDDGSVVFYDLAGNPISGIAAPWALDADGAEVPTHYSIDGTTLVQTIDHAGAVYPVVADPWWVPVVWVGLRVAPVVVANAPRISQAFQTCMRAGCAVIASTVARTVSSNIPTSGSSNSGGQRPTNTCNARNRSGC